jgi:hypothetical protein
MLAPWLALYGLVVCFFCITLATTLAFTDFKRLVSHSPLATTPAFIDFKRLVSRLPPHLLS